MIIVLQQHVVKMALLKCVDRPMQAKPLTALLSTDCENRCFQRAINIFASVEKKSQFD
jgi:hypothetical protein